MMCYTGIDLHATNSVIVVLDEADRVLYQKRLVPGAGSRCRTARFPRP
jgi:hypothetical protein